MPVTRILSISFYYYEICFYISERIFGFSKQESTYTVCLCLDSLAGSTSMDFTESLTVPDKLIWAFHLYYYYYMMKFKSNLMYHEQNEWIKTYKFWVKIWCIQKLGYAIYFLWVWYVICILKLNSRNDKTWLLQSSSSV